MNFSSLKASVASWADTSALLPDPAIAALISAVATTALIIGFGPKRVAAKAPQTNALGDTHDPTTIFRINGQSVQPVTEAARELLEALGRDARPLAKITEYVSRDRPDIRKMVENLVMEGESFRTHTGQSNGGYIEVLGEVDGPEVTLTIRPASADAMALRDAQSSLDKSRAEVRFLRAIADQAPVLAWSIGPDEQVNWANAAYRAQFNQTGGDLPDYRISRALEHALEEVPLAARGIGERNRVSLASDSGPEPQWYEIHECAGASGEKLRFATSADELIAAESALKRFVETLTETFAHLPIGLAVFDKNRRLGLFNPALTELVRIDAVWLAGRPSLRDFLERLRETRQMPDQKDFTAWRRKLTELEEGARDGTYEENWELPSGKIFRVTGRPHPQGALAFLFEDISTAIQLERRYRSELDLSRATLDRLRDAISVFDASGRLIFVNSAFHDIWGTDQISHLEGPGINEICEIWKSKSEESAPWARLTEFATAAEARARWQVDIRTTEGRLLEMIASPLPDASSLVVFRDVTDSLPSESATDADNQDDLLDELALEQLRGPIENALEKMMAAIPSTQSEDAYKKLNLAVQSLKEGLARSRQTRALARDLPYRKDSPLSALAAALAGRDLDLDAPEESRTWTASLRGAAMAIGLAAADHALAGTTVKITIETDDDDLILLAVAKLKTLAFDKGGAGLSLAERIVGGAGGQAASSTKGDTLTIRATLPAAINDHDQDDGPVQLNAGA